MKNCKFAPTPLLLRVRLEDGEDTPLVDSTLYRQLVGSLLYLTHSILDLSYASWEQSPSSCRSHMSYIGRLQSISFDTYKEPSPLGFTMQQTLHWTSSGSLILNGLAIALIASPHLVTHSILVSGLSVGRGRSRLLLLYLQPRQSIIDLQFCPSTEQTADIFTKTFTKQKFHSLRSCLGVKDTVA
jgi:hypothetical protein